MMRKILISTIACLFIAGFCAAGHAQDEGDSETAMEESMDTGGATN